jgi:hypothetical protein
VKVTAFRKKSPPGRHGEAPWVGLGRIRMDLGGFWIPLWFPISSFFSQNEGQKRQQKKKQIFECTVAGYAQPLMSFRHVIRTGLEDGLTRQCAGVAGRAQA